MSARQIAIHPEPFEASDPAEQQANRDSLDQIKNSLQQGMGLVRQSVAALTEWVSAGRWMYLPGTPYATLGEFIDAEFGFLRELAFPAAERRELVALMSRAGQMNQRAIAGRLGVSVGTVNGDCSKLNIAQSRAASEIARSRQEREQQARLMIAAGAGTEQIREETGLRCSTIERIGCEVLLLEEIVKNQPPAGTIPQPSSLPAASHPGDGAIASVAPETATPPPGPLAPAVVADGSPAGPPPGYIEAAKYDKTVAELANAREDSKRLTRDLEDERKEVARLKASLKNPKALWALEQREGQERVRKLITDVLDTEVIDDRQRNELMRQLAIALKV